MEGFEMVMIEQLVRSSGSFLVDERVWISCLKLVRRAKTTYQIWRIVYGFGENTW